MRKIENPYMRKKNEIAKKIEENERELDAITSFFTKLLAQLGTFKYTKSRRGKLIMSIFPITEKYLPDINDWTRKDIYNGLREMSLKITQLEDEKSKLMKELQVVQDDFNKLEYLRQQIVEEYTDESDRDRGIEP